MPLRENLNNLRNFFQIAKIPIVSELLTASWPNWREGIRELIVTLFFSLMPIWLGLLIVNFLTITDGTSGFIKKFASSSDLGILSASLLGPMLYMMFREEKDSDGNGMVPGFPSGLWFIMITVAACIVATVIYSFTYVSNSQKYFDNAGALVSFVQPEAIATVSWSLFFMVVVLTLCASTIRNSIETQPARMMSRDTQSYVDQFQAAQDDSANFADQLRAAQGTDNAAAS